MKLNAVNANTTRQNKQNININTNNKQNKNVNFKGFTDTLVKTWEIIDGSRGIQFTVEDMLGTNIPRTYSGAMSGYEYTGEINWPYLLQEGIREFLTGPTMTCAPIAILALITKASGKTANTHKENIVNLSYLASQLKPEQDLDEESFTKEFIKKVTQDTLEKTINSDPRAEKVAIEEADVDELSNLIIKYTQQTKPENNETGFKGILENIKGFFDKTTKSQNKQKNIEAKNIIAQTQEKFEDIVKKQKTSFKDTDFGVAKYSVSNTQTGATAFENYVKYIGAYVNDYAKANKDKEGLINLAQETIVKFRDSWSAKRLGTIGAMIIGTGFIMSFIPKLYTLASGGINPGGKAIYDEAAKRESK